MVFTQKSLKRRGLGSIIGAVFLLLILLTGFYFNSIYFNQVQKYTNTMQEMHEFDSKRVEEKVDFVRVSTTAMDILNITLENDGSYQTHLIYMSVTDLVSPPEYNELDVYIDPGEMITDFPDENITVYEGEEREIQIITELGNVFTYTYPRDSGDVGEWESELSKIMLRGLGKPVNPSRWYLAGGTENVSGGVSDLTSDDGNYVTFRSYFSGNVSDIIDFVDDDSSNVDGSADIGTHGNFSAQQDGPDTTSDTLLEENIPSVNNWGITSSSFSSTFNPTNYRYMGGMSPDQDQMRVTKLHIRVTGPGAVAIALYTGGTLNDPRGAVKRTEAYNVPVVAGWNEIDVPDYDWGRNTVTWIGWTLNTGVYYSTSSADCGDFQSGMGRWSQTYPADADETQPMPTNPGGGGFSNYWYAMYAEYESPVYQLDLEVQWTGVDYTQTNEELAIYMGIENPYSLDATGGYMLVGDGTPDWGTPRGTLSFWIKWDVVGDRPWGQHNDMEFRFSGSNIVLDWGSTGTLSSSTSFSPNTWYFIAVTWNENSDEAYLYVGDENNTPTVDAFDNNWVNMVSGLGSTENSFMASRGGVDPTNGHGDELRYWNIDRSEAEIQSDYKKEITGAESNLRSYFMLNNDFDDVGPDDYDGSGSGSYSFSSDTSFGGSSENLQVDAWDGGAWQNLIAVLNSGWNNVSVSSYLDSSTFTIRFKDAIDTGDDTQSSWVVDASLLHLLGASGVYITDVEFQGSSNVEDWTEIEWKIDSSWDNGTVAVVIQLYNYVKSGYPTSGDGYLSYVSDITPGTDELITQTITLDPTDFRDSSGNWKVKIKGEKSSVSQYNMNVDLISFRPTYPTAGNVVLYDTWQGYRIEAKTAEGDPIPYAYTTIYGYGSDISLRDALTLAPLTNPEWVYLDEKGTYLLDLKSSHGTPEVLTLRAVVGSIMEEKTITQEAP